MVLKGLSEAAGVAGDEKDVRNLILDRICDLARTEIDALGNLIAFKGKGTGKPRVMLAAHMDEVGLILSRVERNGLLRFKKVGGIDDRILPSQPVRVGPGKVPGVIGAGPVHLQKPEAQRAVFKTEDLYVDIGARTREEAEQVIKLGDYISFVTAYQEFGDGLARGKAFDDRVGCTALMEILEKDYDFPVYAVFTVQEEVGLRGAGTAAFRINPDLALVVEATTCADTPETEEHGEATRLGQGPAVSLMDATSIADRRIVRHLVELADKNGIPIQYRRATAGGNDSGRIHLTRTGVPTASLSVPCRYLHSPVCVISLRDLEYTIQLLGLFLDSIQKGGFRL